MVDGNRFFFFFFQVLILFFEHTVHPLSCNGTSQEGWELQVSQFA